MITVKKRTENMAKIGFVDLEILFLGIKGNGNFNEKDIEDSNLKRLGVGRILDSLASLKDRGLIELNSDGSFSITNLARHILWDEITPLWAKILRLLEIKSFSSDEIADFLRQKEKDVFEEIERLRKNQLVLMSPQRIDSKVMRIYEILPEGIEKIKTAEKEGFGHNLEEKTKEEIEIIPIINQIIKEINDLEIAIERKNNIISGLLQIKEKLQI
jgi:hypothetical protein